MKSLESELNELLKEWKEQMSIFIDHGNYDQHTSLFHAYVDLQAVLMSYKKAKKKGGAK